MVKYIAFCLLMVPTLTWGACDCGSTNQSSPCEGQSISVTVTAGTPNEGIAEDAVFNWTFNSGGGDARCGQFANGDYWVAPAVGETDVIITNLTTTSDGTVTADADPVPEAIGVLDGTNNYDGYDAAQTLSWPETFTGINSILAAMQRNEATEGNCGAPAIEGECADAYNIVTVLSSVPANAGSTVIRPNITGASKDLLNLSDFDFTRLPNKDYLIGANTAGLEEIRHRWSHTTEIFGPFDSTGTDHSEGGRAYRSHILTDDYGAGYARQYYDDIMTLLSDDNTLSEQQAALAAMMSFGLDLYHLMHDSGGVLRYWGTGAGQHPGRFITAAFMAALMVDDTYANVLSTTSSNMYDPGYEGPAELAQVHVGANGPTWGDIRATSERRAYWSDLFDAQCYETAIGDCTLNHGTKANRDPYGYTDGPATKPGDGYIQIMQGSQRSLVAVGSLMSIVADIINFTALFDYADRTDAQGIQTLPDLCVTPDSRESLDCLPWSDGDGCSYYGVTWGPTSVGSVETADCIKTVTPGFTQQSRFPAINGLPLDPTYTSAQVEANWDVIREEGGGPTPPDITGSVYSDGASIITGD